MTPRKPAKAKPKGGKRPGAGRPRLLDTPEGQEKAARCLQALRGGNFRNVACDWAGIAESSFREWMAEGEKGTRQSSVDFRRQVLEAEKAAEIRAVALVMKAAANDPRHAEWWLERKHPDRWGRKDRLQAEVSGPEGGPVQVAATTTLAMLADPVARKLAAQLSERLAGGASPSDGPEDLTGGDAE
jgi:transposase